MSAEQDIERLVLGACLIEDDIALDVVTAALLPEHFTLDAHINAYRVILHLYRTQQPVNVVTVIQELIALNQMEQNTASYIAGLTEGLPRRMGEQSVNYVSRLKEFWKKRRLWSLGEELAAGAQDVGETAQSLTTLAQDRLEAILSDSSVVKSAAGDLTDEVLNRFETERGLEQSPGMSFGISQLDELTGGIMPGYQVVVGARSGVGKTTLMAQTIAANCKAGLSVDAFLLEPTRHDLLKKLWSIESKVAYSKVLYPWTCPEEDAWRIRRAAGDIAEWPLRIHDRSGMKLDEILGLARLGMNRYDSRLICVDYLQRVKIQSQDAREDMRLKVGRASTAFADLVKDTQTATLLLSQLSRRVGVETIPTMQDLRESGQIENDAHTIVLLHLNYDADNGHYTQDGAILVPKQRYGIPCNLKTHFDSRLAVWEAAQTVVHHREHWNERVERRTQDV